jgi:hypothetical protein
MEALIVVAALLAPILLAVLSLLFAADSRPPFSSSQRNWR